MFYSDPLSLYWISNLDLRNQAPAYYYNNNYKVRTEVVQYSQ
jgi:hypothetical protein